MSRAAAARAPDGIAGESSRARIGLLCAILVAALLFRLRGLDFGLPALLDPDEPTFILIGLKLLKGHTLNPGWFGHPGTTTIYAMALTEVAVFLSGHLTGRYPDVQAFTWAVYHDPGVIFLPGRWVILVSGLLTIALTFRLARRLFDVRVAFLAAVLLAVDPVHIRYSQIIRTDMQETIFVLLALLAALRIADRGWRRDYIVAGVWLGIACATKWPAATAVAGVLAAAALRGARHPAERGAALRGTGLFVVTTVCACIAVSPYLLLDFGTVLSNLHGEERPFHLGATGFGFWGNLGWYLARPLADAMGLGGLAFALAGFVVGYRRRPAVAILGAAALAFILSLCFQHLIWERWVVPILPLLAIAAACAAVRLVDAVRARAPAAALVAGIVTAVVLLVPPLMLADVQAAERITDTRRLATAWARTHVPPGSTVAVEYFAFDTLGSSWRLRFPTGEQGCVEPRDLLGRRVNMSKVGSLRGSRPIIDMGSVGAAAAATCRADFMILANYDRYLAEAERFPEEIADYRRLIAAGRLVAVFRPVAGRVGGPIVRVYRFAR